MHKTPLVVLAVFLCTVVHAEKLVPIKIDTPSNVCGFPGIQFPEDMVVLAAGGLGGKAIDFQIDQSGNTSTQIDVAVNYPDKPVALMLGASEPTIWNIGWTEGTNIVAVFVSGYYRQRVAGIKTGTPLLISSSSDKGPCNTPAFSYEKFNSYDSIVASFGYGLVTNIDEAKNEQKLSQMLFFHPISGIFSVPDGVGKVVIGNPLGATQQLITSSATPPKSFHDKNSPLAGEAGLKEAMRKGTLRRATLKDATKWINALKRKYAIQNRQPPDIPPDLNNAYVVLKKFTYPAGLFGGHSATFYIPEGVPQPTGNYGHSKIYDLNSISLECNGGSACGQAMMNGSIGRGSTQQVMTINSSSGMAVIHQQVESKAVAPKAVGNEHGVISNLSGSRLAKTEAEEATTPALHVIGIYETRSNEVIVNITDNTRPVVLALTAYNRTSWKVNLKEGVNLKRIILAGYHSQSVIGLPPNTPIEVYTYDPSPCELCWQGPSIIHSYENSYKEPDIGLEKITGLEATSFQGGYQGSEFSIFPGMKKWIK